MVRRDVLDDREPEPRAPRLAGTRRVGTVEAFEHALQVPFGDPDTFVGDRQLHRVARPSNPDDHSGARRRVAHGVVEQIRQCRCELPLIPADGEVAVTDHRNGDLAGRSGQPGTVQRLGQHRRDQDRAQVGHRVRTLQPGQVDDLLDETRKPGGLTRHPRGETPDGNRVVAGDGNRLG